MGQLTCKNTKNRRFLTDPTPGRQKFSLFFSVTLVWGHLGSFWTMPSWPPTITPEKCLYPLPLPLENFRVAMVISFGRETKCFLRNGPSKPPF